LAAPVGVTFTVGVVAPSGALIGAGAVAPLAGLAFGFFFFPLAEIDRKPVEPAPDPGLVPSVPVSSAD
jgi:hypothetical protein